MASGGRRPTLQQSKVERPPADRIAQPESAAKSVALKQLPFD